MTIKMTVQYDRSHDDKMTSESLTLWLMTITALSRWQDDNQFTMVDYNAMALCHQWQTGTFFDWWQWLYDTSHDDRMTSRSLWLMTMTLWHKAWWYDDKQVTMVTDRMTSGHYGWWQWLYTVTRDNNLPPLPAREDTTQYDTTFTTQRPN